LMQGERKKGGSHVRKIEKSFLHFEEKRGKGVLDAFANEGDES